MGHLADGGNGESSSPLADRSSASPPPPIRLKLGMKNARSHPVYSDSDDESDAATSTPAPKGKSKSKSEETDVHRSPPQKKQKTGKAKPRSSGSTSGPTLPAQHRKQYDWLQPSSASASHHGPPERLHSHPASSIADPDEARPSGDDSARESVPPPTDKERNSEARSEKGSEKKKTPARRRGADAPPGPGKNWRKGMKKGDPIPWKDGATFLGEPKMRSSPLGTPAQRASMSRDVSPEPIDAILFAAASRIDREPSPPFVLADAKVLGIPVFKNPIVTPKIPLGTFPKVTSFFAPFDNKPFRKETVCAWTKDERTITGVGGHMLKFKTWRPGPQSELGAVLQAQKEADRAAKEAKKKEKDGNASTVEATPERPMFTHSNSADSLTAGVPPAPGSAAGDDVGDRDDGASEMGDDDSVAGNLSMRESPIPAARIHHGGHGRGGASKRGRPRKSKLAQEIILPTEEEGTPASPGLDASAEPSAAAEGDMSDEKPAIPA